MMDSASVPPEAAGGGNGAAGIGTPISGSPTEIGGAGLRGRVGWRLDRHWLFEEAAVRSGAPAAAGRTGELSAAGANRRGGAANSCNSASVVGVPRRMGL